VSVRVDLHTHSTLSPDGGISAKQYLQALENDKLDCIAVTDHNSIALAKELQSELGERKIIIGEEITTNQGDIIGLFLKNLVKANLDIKEAVKSIKSQGGLVYIPHPFETVRSGISEAALESIKDDVDIIEINNGRAFFQNFGPKAKLWAEKSSTVQASSSDAHRFSGLGKTYSVINSIPNVKTLPMLLSDAKHIYARPSILDIMAPKMNRIKKFLRIKQNG